MPREVNGWMACYAMACFPLYVKHADVSQTYFTAQCRAFKLGATSTLSVHCTRHTTRGASAAATAGRAVSAANTAAPVRAGVDVDVTLLIM